MSSVLKDAKLRQELLGLYRQALNAGLEVEEIEKVILKKLRRFSATDRFETNFAQSRKQRIESSLPAVVKWGALALPVLFISIGMYLVGGALLPILNQYFDSYSYAQTASLISPIPQDEVMEITPLVITGAVGATAWNDGEEDIGPQIINEELDYTNLSNWFSSAELPELEQEDAAGGITEYILDIPKIDIENAKVRIGGTDLNQSLIAYPGTALPGELGAPVIFGHSVLRQFYNPSENNPRRYNSIFSYIMTLEPGDRIYVTADGVRYTYMVQSKTEVQPEDVHILLQQYDARRLKLVTCTPEGTYLRRGVVTAQLVEEEPLF